MPRYYINDLGGASKVNMLVGLAPSTPAQRWTGWSTSSATRPARRRDRTALLKCEACVQQLEGASFFSNLNPTPTVSNVKYVIIETEDDEVVTPYTNAFLPAGPNVQNIPSRPSAPGRQRPRLHPLRLECPGRHDQRARPRQPHVHPHLPIGGTDPRQRLDVCAHLPRPSSACTKHTRSRSQERDQSDASATALRACRVA